MQLKVNAMGQDTLSIVVEEYGREELHITFLAHPEKPETEVSIERKSDGQPTSGKVKRVRV
jgi:hypothetical protein